MSGRGRGRASPGQGGSAGRGRGGFRKPYLINYLKSKLHGGDDIAKALTSRQEYQFDSEKPKLSEATSTDKDERRLEELENKTIYDAEVKAFVARKERYRTNKTSAYSIIYGQCTKAMQAKIKSRSDFDTKILNNPIELLNAIEEYSFSFQSNRYPLPET